MKRKFISLFLITCLAFGALSGCGNGSKVSEQRTTIKNKIKVLSEYTDIQNESYVLCGKSENTELYFKPSTTNFYIKNKIDGSEWYSNPENLEKAAAKSKLVEMEMNSNLLVEYANTKNKKTSKVNTYTASVKSRKYSISLLENGVCFKYTIPEIGAEIPLYLYLKSDDLIAEVETGNIKSTSDEIAVTSISVLPYLVSGTVADEGYLFVPDGSGALIRFNSQKSTSSEYSRPIFGEEPTSLTADYYLRCEEESIHIPVYGACVNSGAIMAAINEGAECGSIIARPVGYQSSMANVFVRFGLLNSIEHNVGNYSTKIYDKSNNSLEKISIQFSLLSGDEADYSGMAHRYGKTLKSETKAKSAKDATLYIDFYGGIEKKVSTFGICHNVITPLTTTGQMIEIANDLKSEGIKNITARYRMWNTDEMSGSKITAAGISSRLTKGGSLKEIANNKNMNFYPAVMSVQNYSGGGFIDHIKNSAYSMTKLPFSWHGFSVSTLNETDDITYRVSLPKFQSFYGKFLKSYKKTGCANIALGDIGSKLYCDYRGDGYRRVQAAEIMKSALSETAKTTESIMLDRANSYAIPYADIIYNAPVTNSNHEVLDVSVPFYTLALAGIAECVAPSINNNNIGDDAFLYAVSSGASLCYSWIYADAYELQNTDLANLSDVNYKATQSKALADYKKIQAIYNATDGSRPYSQEYITDDLSVTVYENGSSVFVNFGNKSQKLADGTEIEAKSFIVKEGRRG